MRNHRKVIRLCTQAETPNVMIICTNTHARARSGHATAPNVCGHAMVFKRRLKKGKGTCNKFGSRYDNDDEDGLQSIFRAHTQYVADSLHLPVKTSMMFMLPPG